MSVISAMKPALFLLLIPCLLHAQTPVGAQGTIGAPAGAKVVNRLEITKPGVYENLIIDGEWKRGNLVKITADDVTLRNCEIRHSAGNGIGVFGSKVVIENCRIHHLLNGTFEDQQDAHGISGRWGDLVIRNCDISYPSGDCIQFDPDRQSSGKVVVENCTLWTGPLTADLASFKAGQRPGENALDTKVKLDGPRCQLIIRNCHMHGWNQPAQIDNVAALNLKENVDAEVTHCVFQNNQISLRVRGPGSRGGAHVTVKECGIFDSQAGIRAEDKIEQLKLTNIGFGGDIGQKITFANGKAGKGFENSGEYKAASADEMLKGNFSKP
ncbi:hypothetical protein BGE01nite_09830 [Brevifollis gellanilyticus]|uniref:Right handed beta helix domain-containing protein n=2 Tax=Brevifollis gellanilyticus TaxID=748831 RepID=A0A512M4P4_9BACT|nr:hypothetical protein BGE01nite_09830 [Brevifollis gellanilyticus]